MGAFKRVIEKKMEELTKQVWEAKSFYDDVSVTMKNSKLPKDKIQGNLDAAFEYYYDIVNTLVEDLISFFEGDKDCAIGWMESYGWLPILDFLNI